MGLLDHKTDSGLHLKEEQCCLYSQSRKNGIPHSFWKSSTLGPWSIYHFSSPILMAVAGFEMHSFLKKQQQQFALVSLTIEIVLDGKPKIEMPQINLNHNFTFFLKKKKKAIT